MSRVYGNPTAHLACDLCGHVAANVHAGLACYSDDGRFERIHRCSDHQACRDRLEDAGGIWPLSDLTYSRRSA